MNAFTLNANQATFGLSDTSGCTGDYMIVSAARPNAQGGVQARSCIIPPEMVALLDAYRAAQTVTANGQTTPLYADNIALIRAAVLGQLQPLVQQASSVQAAMAAQTAGEATLAAAVTAAITAELAKAVEV